VPNPPRQINILLLRPLRGSSSFAFAQESFAAKSSSHFNTASANFAPGIQELLHLSSVKF